jgi:hypothetical protein
MAKVSVALAKRQATNSAMSSAMSADAASIASRVRKLTFLIASSIGL